MNKFVIITGLMWMLVMGMAQAGTVTYVYTDTQGTPVMESDAQGNITAQLDYTPYGTQALGSPPDGPGYTGHVNDPDTGLVYMQARYYDPEVGSFLSLDPVGPTPGDLFAFNRYAYADNNPVVNTDPTGKHSASEGDGIPAGDCKVYNCLTFASGGNDDAESNSSSRSSSRGYRNVRSFTVATGATRDANTALQKAGISGKLDSMDNLALAFAAVVQPIADKWDTEIGAEIFTKNEKAFMLGQAFSSGTICSQSSRCDMDLLDAPSSPGLYAFAGYIHSHPVNGGLDAEDIAAVYMMQTSRFSTPTTTAYVTLPNGRVQAWSTSALKLPVNNGKNGKLLDWNPYLMYKRWVP